MENVVELRLAFTIEASIMAGISYLDFDLTVDRAEQGYSAHVVYSPAGQARSHFAPTIADTDLTQFLPRPVSLSSIRTFGRRLFEAVFSEQVLTCLRRSIDEAARQGAGLRIRLRLAGVPELSRLPWEFLYDATTDTYPALSIETPLVRYPDLPLPSSPLTVTPPLKMLAVLANPRDLLELDTQRELASLQGALNGLDLRGLMKVEVLEKATVTALQQRLRQSDYHILHFIAHGAFDSDSGDGAIYLEDESSLGRPISGQSLATFLRDHRSLRMVVLGACEGARADTTDPFGGMAQRLVRQGIPAVIAMQFQISDQAAITFAQSFYGAIADGYGAEAALGEARKAIYAQDNPTEWATPVLYLRAFTGQIFDVAHVSEDERRQAQVTVLLVGAQAALAANELGTATTRLQALLELDPTHAEAAALLKRTRQREELSGLYRKGLEHYDAGRWHEALDYFRRVQEIGGNYEGVFARIATVQSRIKETEGTRTPTPAPRPASALESHLRVVVKAIGEGRLVPFLGAEINRCGRPPGVPWQRGQFAPDRSELAAHLAESYGGSPEEDLNLVEVSQHAAVTAGQGALYQELHNIYDADYPPTPMHQLLASLPDLLRRSGRAPHYPLIVSSNHDDILERTFVSVGEPFDLLTYIAEGEQRGRFWHRPPSGNGHPIERANDYREVALDQRSTILKIHGAVNRSNADEDSFIITEDDHIDYLTRTDVASLIPATVLTRLRKSHFLFLGYSVRDWNLRVILHRIWSDQEPSFGSWAVQTTSQPMDRKIWRKWEVEIIEVELEEYIASLTDRLHAVFRSGGAA